MRIFPANFYSDCVDYTNGGLLMLALTLLRGLDCIQTSWPGLAGCRYAIAIPVRPRLGEGPPLVT